MMLLGEMRNAFKIFPPVDAASVLPDGQTFADITEYEALLAKDTTTLLVENLAEQFMVCANRQPLSFSDRAETAHLVDLTQKQGGGIRTLIYHVVASTLFRSH